MSAYAKIDLTVRIVILVLAMTVGALFVFIGGRNALAASLNRTAIIAGEVFTVGDIFSGVSGDIAGKVLGPAPQPGQDLVLNAGTLMRVAAALDLPWAPASSADQVVIRRAATLVGTDVIKSTLDAALREKGAGTHFEIVFSGTGAPEMIVPQDQPATAEISAIDFDAQSGRFQATLAAPSAENPLTTLLIAGKAEALVSVPVLRASAARGDLIDAYDIEWIDVKSAALQSDTVLKEEDLSGMTPRRVVAAGKPVRMTDLERPQLIKRGDTITIAYESALMSLTAQGKALQNGAKGDLIRVVNTSSNRTIDAFVTGENLVSVVQ